MQRLKAFLKDERGVTAIEYGIVAAIVLVALISAVASYVRG